MFKKILIPLDGSRNAERAIEWLEHYSKVADAEAVLVRVVEGAFQPHMGSGGLAAQLLRREAREYLDGWESRLRKRGVAVTTLLAAGAVAVAILRAAEVEGCDLIVMTTQGGSKVARWLVGGTTERVMRRAAIPVLIAQSHVSLPEQARVKKILVPLDGSPLAEAILPWAEALARFHQGEVTFFHVKPAEGEFVSTRYRRTLEELSARMEKTCGEWAARGIAASFRLEEGDAADEILKIANKHFDLIATTTNGFGGLSRWVLGSVAEKVLHHAEVPVFVYKAPVAGAKRREKAIAEVSDDGR